MSNKIGPNNEGRKGGKKEEEEKEDGREEEEDDDEKVSLKRANVLNGGDGGATSDGGDSDEFSDVVVLDPLGREEERPPKQQKQPNISNNSPQKEATPQTNSSISPPIQIQQPQIPEMDPSPVYPNLQQSTHQGSQNQQSWFSSNQLPSFLASSNEENDGNQQQQTASASFLRICGELRARLQPWGKFFQPAKFGLPPGLVAIGPRIKYNLGHFLSNYLCLFVVLLIYCILTSFLMLLTLIVLAGLCYTIYQRTQKGPVILGGQEIPPSLLYTLALMICIPLFYMANAGSVMYWVIGTGLFLILAHATFYASEEVPGQEFEVVSVVTA